MRYLTTLLLLSLLAPPLCMGKMLYGGVDTTEVQTGSQVNTMRLQSGIQDTSIQSGTHRAGFRLLADHGLSELGVAGCYFVTTANNMYSPAPHRIIDIYPNSDLNRFGIVPGDVILTVEGQRGNTQRLRSLLTGTPGTPVSLEILHNGYPVDVTIIRVPAADCLQNDYDGYYHWCQQQTRQW